MRKLLFVIALAVSAITNAQTGSWYVGGELGVGGSKSESGGIENKQSNWSVAPEVGVNLNETIQLGVALNLTGSKSEDNVSSDVDKTFYFGPLVYVRKFFPLGEQFALFGGVYGQYISGKNKFNDEDRYKQTGFIGDLKCGFGFYPAERWTILGSFGLFNFRTIKSEDVISGTESKSSSWDLGINSLGPVFDIGIYYTFISK